MAPILIVGIGNILLRDEGVGVRVIESLRRQRLPAGVEIVDGGTSGADLIDYIADRRKLIVVDAVKSGQAAGTVLRFSDQELIARSEGMISLHEFGLVETLLAVRQLGCAPQRVVIYGIEPADTGCGLELSAEVAAVVPRVVDLVVQEAVAGV